MCVCIYLHVVIYSLEHYLFKRLPFCTELPFLLFKNQLSIFVGVCGKAIDFCILDRCFAFLLIPGVICVVGSFWCFTDTHVMRNKCDEFSYRFREDVLLVEGVVPLYYFFVIIADIQFYQILFFISSPFSFQMVVISLSFLSYVV